MTKLNIKSLVAASVDIGDGGHPGSSASKITCIIRARCDGRWEAEGYYSTGCNQGYYQENYGHGPWTGRGDTARKAVADMVGRADDEYQADMRRAGHDALLECDESTFTSLAEAEADRIQTMVENNTVNVARSGNRYVRVAGVRYDADDDDALTDIQVRAVKMLRRLAGNAGTLSGVSDADLLAEVERRGLINAAT